MLNIIKTWTPTGQSWSKRCTWFIYFANQSLHLKDVEGMHHPREYIIFLFSSKIKSVSLGVNLHIIVVMKWFMCMRDFLNKIMNIAWPCPIFFAEDHVQLLILGFVYIIWYFFLVFIELDKETQIKHDIYIFCILKQTCLLTTYKLSTKCSLHL